MHPDTPRDQSPSEKSDKQGRVSGNDDHGTTGSAAEKQETPPEVVKPSDKEPGRKGDQPA